MNTIQNPLYIIPRYLMLIAFVVNGNDLIFAQNPLTPPGIYFADPSARVFNGNLFLYGSLDESCDYYCSWKHHILETSDLKNWVLHEDRFFSKGEGDEVPYNDQLLFAPDCAFAKDTFYLYYCQPDSISAEGVATSLSPAGPFYGGQKLNLPSSQEIDPSVFIDNDGQAYYVWGQFSLKMAKMGKDMRNLDFSSFRDSILTEELHHFHEGAFLTRHGNLYYLVYADISRSDMPTCLGYSVSENPFGPYTYKGVIIDNDGCNPGNWNNHGSIASFRDQWYVFYHRSTHGCDKMRKVCMEPITFLPDGTIPEVEMTSQGAGGTLPATSRIEAEWACLLRGNSRIQLLAENQEGISGIENGDKAVYKYLDFNSEISFLEINMRTGKNGCRIVVSADKPWHTQIAEIVIDSEPAGNEWKTYTVPVKGIEGTHALWLQFYGNEESFLEIDWFRFY